jgi:hypothetical protein
LLVIFTGSLEQYAQKEGKEERKEERKKVSRFRRFELLKLRHTSTILSQPILKRILN